MKQASMRSIIAGFLVLFVLYHLAEYMIVFRNSATGFLIIQALFFLAAFLIARWQFGKGLSVWGFVKNKNLGKQMLAGLCIGIAVYGITFYCSVKLGAEHIVQLPDTRSAVRLAGLFVFGNFFSSFSEDILTRGYVFRHTQQKINSYLIILVSAIIYVLNHIYRWGDGWETYGYLFCLGLLFIIPLVKTGQIWTTGCMHWAGNCTFYCTHEVIKTAPGNYSLSPNIILIIVLCFFLFLFLLYFRLFKK